MTDGEDRLTAWLMQNREPLLINHVAKSPFRLPVSLWKSDVQSLLAAPLAAADKMLGCLFVGKRMEYSFEQEDVDTLRTFGEQVVIAIENARLVAESLVKERLEQELRIAHYAQMKLLPKAMPEFPGIELAAICMTANEVGGDYYDFFNLPGGNLGIVVGDVSGKGPSAAFIMAELKGIMEAFARQSISPKEMLISANKILYSTLDRNTFVSVIYGIWDAKEHLFTFCRAGQCPLVLVESGAGQAKVLEPYGMGLGLDQGDLFADSLQEVTLRVASGDTLLFYTDGAVEARNSQGHEFGEPQLNTLFEQHANQSAEGLLTSLVHGVREFMGSVRQHDDLTFVILKMK
jgi:serine phosphatase RsbU (regulator of sigma subunit)